MTLRPLECSTIIALRAELARTRDALKAGAPPTPGEIVPVPNAAAAIPL